MAGRIPEEKIRQLQDAFNQAADKRGLVRTRNIEMVLKHLGESPAKEDVQDMINKVDKDSSGVFRFPEFLSMMTARVRLPGGFNNSTWLFRVLVFQQKRKCEKLLQFLIWLVVNWQHCIKFILCLRTEMGSSRETS